MARIKMVTRTIVSTNVECMVVNTETASVSIENYTITGSLSADEAKSILNNRFKDEEENNVVVKCTVLGTSEQLFGMSETEFLLHAYPLPPRTKADADAE